MTTSIQWDVIENVYFDVVSKCIRKFAIEHNDEEFYTVWVESNFGYKWIQLHLNTENHLFEMARTYPDRFPETYQSMGFGEVVEDIRWDAGTWAPYFAVQPEETSALKQVRNQLEQIEQKTRHSDLLEPFLDMCARIAIRLELTGVIQELHLSENFVLKSVDEHESVEEGDSRLQRIRDSIASSN